MSNNNPITAIAGPILGSGLGQFFTGAGGSGPLAQVGKFLFNPLGFFNKGTTAIDPLSLFTTPAGAAPTVPTLPAAPAVPTITDATSSAAPTASTLQQQQIAAASSQGFGSTILTSGLGDPSGATVGKKQLLGQ